VWQLAVQPTKQTSNAQLNLIHNLLGEQIQPSATYWQSLARRQ